MKAYNNSFKPFATLTRTPCTPHLLRMPCGMIAQQVLRARRHLTRRWAS